MHPVAGFRDKTTKPASACSFQKDNFYSSLPIRYETLYKLINILYTLYRNNAYY